MQIQIPYPVVTKALAARMERAEIDYMVSRVEAIRERAGNRMGAEVRQFGGATALYVKEMPWATFNTVKGIGADDIGFVDEIVGFYRERNRSCQFELIPPKTNAELLGVLHEQGFRQIGFHTTLYGVPTMEMAPFADSPGIAVRELAVHEFELYGKLHCLGTGLNPDGASHVAANNQVLYDRPGWRFFIGFADGQPAGVAVMHRHNAIASLTFAATLPEFRRRGLQSAFLHTRIREAVAAGCELVVGQAAYASVSQNNMERAGMRIGYTRATWTQG